MSYSSIVPGTAVVRVQTRYTLVITYCVSIAGADSQLDRFLQLSAVVYNTHLHTSICLTGKVTLPFNAEHTTYYNNV